MFRHLFIFLHIHCTLRRAVESSSCEVRAIWPLELNELKPLVFPNWSWDRSRALKDEGAEHHETEALVVIAGDTS